MSSSYKAVVAESYSSPPNVQSLNRPTPANGEVLVRILATPILAYEKYILNGSMQYPLKFPLTPGSSAIARIEEPLPSDAVALCPGQLVFCDITVRARDDPDVLFLLGVHGGMGPSLDLMEGPWRNGSFAEVAKWPLENVYPVNEERLCSDETQKGFGYSFADLAYLGACLVPFGGLAGKVNAGDIIIVAPATGQFGGAAVCVALAMGASVIAAGRNKVTLAKIAKVHASTGRISTVALSGDPMKDSESFKQYTSGGKGADVYIDLSPPEATNSTHILAATLAMKRGGTIVLMGGVGGHLSLPYSLVMHSNLQICGNFMYDRATVVQAIKMVEQGSLGLSEKDTGVKSNVFGLEQFGEAVEAAAAGKGWGSQAVLKP